MDIAQEIRKQKREMKLEALFEAVAEFAGKQNFEFIVFLISEHSNSLPSEYACPKIIKRF